MICCTRCTDTHDGTTKEARGDFWIVVAGRVVCDSCRLEDECDDGYEPPDPDMNAESAQERAERAYREKNENR